MNKILIFCPTLNESGTIETLIGEIYDLKLPADMLVVDDGSVDGTVEIIKQMQNKYKNLFLHQRVGVVGIGSAHIEAIKIAKDKEYDILVSLDADFSHKPSDITRLLGCLNKYDLVVGTRFIDSESLKEWSLMRKILTHAGHFLTKKLLALPYDASGALRAYKLKSIDEKIINYFTFSDYSFFFESMCILSYSGVKIGEISIELPARTYGHSKMKLKHLLLGVVRLFVVAYRCRIRPRYYSEY